MYRTKIDNLTLAEVKEIIGSGKGPDFTSAPCGFLVGKSLTIVLDEKPVAGPKMAYEFLSETELTVSVDGAEKVKCAYGAKSLRGVTLFTHMMPGEMKAYAAAVEWKTGIVTVFEYWFIDYEGRRDLKDAGIDVMLCSGVDPFTNREIQRQAYFGYIEEEGKEAPEKRHSLSLRLDNHSIAWKDERGFRQLYTYTTCLFSTRVDLDDPDGDDVLTLPSDYYQISNDLFVFSSCEVEYRGNVVCEIIDVVANKKIGVEFGIDEHNEFIYRLYAAEGKFAAQYSVFYDFNDEGNALSPNVQKRLSSGIKGARCTYRTSIMAHKLDDELLKEYATNHLHILDVLTDPEFKPVMSSERTMMDESTQLVGRELTVRGDDGFVCEYKFHTVHDLEYRKNGEETWHKELYKPFQVDDDLVCFGHYLSDVYPPTAHIVIVDLADGRATCIDSTIGAGVKLGMDLRDAYPTYHFGVVETEGVPVPRVKRHGFTTELLGKSFTWTYSKTMTSQHIYNSPHSYSWTIINNTKPGDPMNRAGGYVWSSPCDYIKLRNDVYIMDWVEQRWEGIMGVAVMNLKMMHDCGFNFGIGSEGESVMLDVMGAYARNAGSADLREFYDIR